MPATMTEIRELLHEKDTRCLASDDGEDLLIAYRGRHGKIHVMLSCQKGIFLQLKSSDIPPVLKNDPTAGAVLKEIASLNSEVPFLKVVWEPSGGEIVGVGDAWLVDNGLTAEQLSVMIECFVRGMDEAAWRIREAVRTGKAKFEREFDELCDKLVSAETSGQKQ